MPPTLADRVLHILEAIEAIESALANKGRTEFAQDRLLRLAIERLLEIICEATRHIPDDVKAGAPAIPWPRVIDLGNRLRHAYHRIDPDIIWLIVEDDLPPLRSFIETIIAASRK